MAAVANAAGVLPPDWETFRAYGTDRTGNAICGMGRDTDGKLEAYVLVMDSTPPSRPPSDESTEMDVDAGEIE